MNNFPKKYSNNYSNNIINIIYTYLGWHCSFIHFVSHLEDSTRPL
jgi:hypothetical protein